MTLFQFSLAFLCLAGCCSGQVRGGADPKEALPLVRKVLSSARLSGSLEYWGRCNFSPDFPKLRIVDTMGAPLETLRSMFAGDPFMSISQDVDGKIRMAESDVPKDILEVKIGHLSFPAGEMAHGPQVALLAILRTPEVIAFGRTHKIESISSLAGGGYSIPGNAGGGKAASGTLSDITVAQALDHVLVTFPGFWLYETCQDQKGARTIFVNFYENAPVGVPDSKN